MIQYQRRPAWSGIMHIGNSFAFDPRVDRIPKRRKTSEQVTRMERMMRMMMIHVRPVESVISIGWVKFWGQTLTRHLVVCYRV